MGELGLFLRTARRTGPLDEKDVADVAAVLEGRPDTGSGVGPQALLVGRDEDLVVPDGLAALGGDLRGRRAAYE